LINPDILAVFPPYLETVLEKKGALECYPIVLVLFQITTSCTRNLSVCHSGAFVSRLLEFGLKVLLRPDENPQLQKLLDKYIKALFDMDTKTEYLRCLFSRLENLHERSPQSQTILTDLIQYALNRPRAPDFVHFQAENNPCHGYIKIEDYGRPFPPQYGYSLVTWIKLDVIDRSQDLQIMSIIDSDGSVRLLLFIDADTKKLSLQTMKSTVVIDGVTLNTGLWYHLALVHQKPMLSASTLKVFLNGKLTDTLKCGYMGPPGSSTAVSTYLGSAGQTGLRTAGHSWNLGPTLFLEEILLEPKAIWHMYQNAYKCSGNWQGVILDSKQLAIPVDLTESESVLDPVSTITSMVYAGPTTVADFVGFKEDKIFLSLAPGADTRLLAKEYFAEPLSLIRYQAQELNASSKSLVALTRPSFLFNENPQICKIVGDLICCRTENVFDAVWRLGGPALFLRMVETSTVSYLFIVIAQLLIISDRLQTI
jgi:hypothetical protein